MHESPPTSRRARRPAPATRRVGVLGVIGEILLTAGVVLALFVVWQLWIGDAVIAAQRQDEASALAESWAEGFLGGETPASPAPAAPGTDAVPVMDAPPEGTDFGVMHVPRFGADWQFTMTTGTHRRTVLDAGKIGHYDGTAMPGGEGNMAVAAHRWTSGAPFDPVDRLVIGDAIVVETEAGWYTYRFRNLEYVQDTQVEVLAAVPQQVDLAADGRYLTLTSCAPKLNMLERIISYAVFDEFTPRDEGAPAALTEGVAA